LLKEPSPEKAVRPPKRTKSAPGALLFPDEHEIAAIVAGLTNINAMSRDEFRRRVEGMDPAMRGIMKMLVRRVREMADDLSRNGQDVNWTDWRRKN